MYFSPQLFLHLNTLVPMKFSNTNLQPCSGRLNYFSQSGLGDLPLLWNFCLQSQTQWQAQRHQETTQVMPRKHIIDQIGVRHNSSKLTQDTQGKSWGTRWGRCPWGKWKGGQRCIWAVPVVQIQPAPDMASVWAVPAQIRDRQMPETDKVQINLMEFDACFKIRLNIQG